MEKSLNRHNVSFINKLVMLLLAILPILAWYKIPFPVGLGNALMLFISPLVIIKSKFKINALPKAFWVVFLYICLIWMFNNNFALWTLFPPGGWQFFIFTLTLWAGIVSFDIEHLKKYMRWIVIIASILFWIQLSCLVVTGSPKFCFVPNLTGVFTYENLSYSEVVSRHLGGNMPCSIFLEKSYLAYYFLTYLALIWSDVTKDGKLINKEVVLVIITLIASRSGTAIIGLAILSISQGFSLFSQISQRKKIAFSICTILFLFAGIYVYLSTEMGQDMLSRTKELTTEGTSGHDRVVAGYLIFSQLTPEERIIGIPDARQRYGREKSDGSVIFYVNGVQSILITLGYIGALLYLLFYTSIYHKVSFTSKMCIIILLVMGLLEANYLNPYMMLLTIIPCSEIYMKKNIKRNEKNNACLRHPSRSNQDGSACQGVPEIS